MPESRADNGPVSATVVVAQHVAPGQEQAYLRWQAEIDDLCRGFAGFESVDVVPPVSGVQDDYVVVYRFDSAAHLDAWLKSDERGQLLAQGEALFTGAARQQVVAGAGGGDGVGMVVSTRVKAGREQEYRAWQDRIDAEAARFPGCLGNQIYPPLPGVQDEWVVVVRFDTAEHLQAWLNSDVRQTLVADAASLWDEARVEQLAGGFPGWFPTQSKGAAAAAVPPNWKQAMVVLLVLFPTVRFTQLYIEPHLMSLPFSPMIFVENIIGVVVLTWLLMPLVNRAFAFWLNPSGPNARRNELLGFGLLIVGYVVVISIFHALS